MKTLLILWTTVAAISTIQAQLPDCSTPETFPWYFNNPINCQAFFLCLGVDEGPFEGECDYPYNFHELNQKCESPIEFPCEEEEPEDPEITTTAEPPTTTEEPPTTTAEPPTTTVRPPPPRNVCEGLPDGRLVNNPTGCRSFFECRNEVAFPRQCDMGLNFNEELQMCDRPAFTPCSNDDFECPYFGVSRWEVLGSCTEYHFCFAGQHRIEECAPGLTFDTELALCALKENVDCTRDLCPIYNDIDNIVTYPSEYSCEEYYKCYDGNLELQHCAPGTHWNQERQRCERPEDAECEVVTEPPEDPTEEPTEPTEPPVVVTCLPSEEVFFMPHPLLCQHYFLCADEVPHERRCLDGLLFDSIFLDCYFEDEATCAEGAVRPVPGEKEYFLDYITRRFINSTDH